MEPRERLRTFLREEQGVGVIKLVFVLMVFIGLVIIFKKQIIALLEDILKGVNSQSKEMY